MSETQDSPIGQDLRGEVIFQDTFEAIPDAAMLWHRSENGAIALERVNAAAMALSRGLLRRDLGIALDDFFSHQPLVAKMINQVFLTGQSHCEEMDYRLRSTNEHHWLRASFTKVGQQRVLCIVADLTDRRKIEQALQASEQAQRDMANMLQALLEINLELTDTPDGRTLCRRAVELARQRLGFERMGIWFATDEPRLFTGSVGVDEQGNLREEWHCRIDNAEDTLIQRSFAQRQSFGLRDQDILRNHSGNPVGQGSRAVAPLRDGQRMIGFVTVDNFLSGRTITPTHVEILKLFALSLGHQWTRKQAEEQYRQSQKMEAIGRLAGGIAHDFNNQLTVVMGYCQMLLRDLADGNPVRTSVAEIYHAAQRSHQLTSQLLSFSRRQVLHPEVVNLSEALGKMLEPLGRLIGERIELSAQLPTDVSSAKVDRAQLEQAVMNLVINARDAMPSGGKLELQVADVVPDAEFVRAHEGAARTAYVMLSVRDTGSGMDEQTLQHIFDPFFTTKEVGKGTGLGLAMAYGFIRQSNGIIDVESRPGEGATFRIYLPACGSALVTEEHAAPEKLDRRGTETVLVVEDDDAVRTMLNRVLCRSGYTVLLAANGREALHVGETYKEKIHLLLTDMVLPTIAGEEIADRLAASRPELKVLRITGYAGTRPTSGRPILFKPLTPSALIQKVRQVLQQP